VILQGNRSTLPSGGAFSYGGLAPCLSRPLIHSS